MAAVQLIFEFVIGSFFVENYIARKINILYKQGKYSILLIESSALVFNWLNYTKSSFNLKKIQLMEKNNPQTPHKINKIQTYYKIQAKQTTHQFQN